MDKLPDTALIRDASRRIVRELGFMRPTLAGTDFAPSSVHALIEIGRNETLTAADLCTVLDLEKSSVSRMVRKLVLSGELSEEPNEEDARSKSLSLTGKGRSTLAAINAYADDVVISALGDLPATMQAGVRDGLVAYAGALEHRRAGKVSSPPTAITIESGYQPGIIGRCAEMHGRYYARTNGFGYFFESKVAAGIAEFSGRLERPVNRIWSAKDGDKIIGTVAIDGEDLGGRSAHLRWFIMEDGYRGAGIGKRLLDKAISFCVEQRFLEVQLWTFKGLDAARRLYEAHGFVLTEEQPGRQWGTEVLEQRFTLRFPEV
ncbi:helix-turn-helix domain-containing GNAT family N-acetyltransferase [Phyllobacterium sp. YR531]|uniref:bifunctional helix-turn-helix transcriptional regulator/GNAT family N-acetyltransferase n=1 Tax=Phyllobacterium sp. YR531 TaxID=1144343 RepID=UPI00026FCC33|nr:helix-turn-helix domain-containing GNAT family N-acetyltransferase [Phyllobacterium sp. YR531]EJN03051.1 transcriptional regulator [Phyllobacterium sp. YR531]